MKKPLPDRLRERARYLETRTSIYLTGQIEREAADEIERLSGVIERMAKDEVFSEIGDGRRRLSEKQEITWAFVVLAVGLIFGLIATARAQSPASELAAAIADIERVPEFARPGTRYLSLYGVEPAKRDEAARIVSYSLNVLSSQPAIVPPTRVSPTLLRFQIANYSGLGSHWYDWFNAWEKLAEFDSWFHIRTQINKGKDTTTDGGWVGLANANKLRFYTTSIGGILRADDFVYRAMLAPAYYDFTGIPDNQLDLYKQLGINGLNLGEFASASAAAYSTDVAANLLVSNVTQKPRQINRFQGIHGAVWLTLDVQQIDAARDPFRRPIPVNGTRAKFDASEWFIAAPNGLWHNALYDADGNRQDSVPDKVAKDTSDPSGDGIIHAGLSCIRCHRESGLRPFVDDQSKLFAGGVKANSSNPFVVGKLATLYDEQRIQSLADADRQRYARSAKLASGGLDPGQIADGLAAMVRNYQYGLVDLPQAAREVGVDESQLTPLLQRSNDPVLLLLAQGRSVHRDQWASSFAEIALTASAYLGSAIFARRENGLGNGYHRALGLLERKKP